MAFSFQKLQIYQKAITFADAGRAITRDLRRLDSLDDGTGRRNRLVLFMTGVEFQYPRLARVTRLSEFPDLRPEVFRMDASKTALNAFTVTCARPAGGTQSR